MAVSIKQQLKHCQESQTALLATNFYNMKTQLAILKASATAYVPTFNYHRSYSGFDLPDDVQRNIYYETNMKKIIV